MNKHNDNNNERHGVWINTYEFSNGNKDSNTCIYHNGIPIGYQELKLTYCLILDFKKIYHLR